MYYSHGMFAHHKIVLTLYSYTRIYLYVTASCRLNRLFKAKLVQSSGRNDSINYRLIGRLGESMIEKFIIDLSKLKCTCTFYHSVSIFSIIKVLKQYNFAKLLLKVIFSVKNIDLFV